jgi:phosphate-selective porin OprO/OprP
MPNAPLARSTRLVALQISVRKDLSLAGCGICGYWRDMLNRTLTALVLFPLIAPLARAGDTGPFSPITFGNGVEFKDPEGRFQTHLRFRMQNLFAYETQGTGDFDADRLTAQVRRLRVRFGGWAADPRLGYNLQLSFSRGDQDWNDSGFPNVIRDATVVWRATPHFQFSFGQSKLPGNRQRVVSSGEMQFADRSIVNRRFNLDRDFAFQTFWQPTAGQSDGFLWNVKAALGAGRGRNADAAPFSAVLVTRAEALPFGEFKDNGDYFEGDLAREPRPKLSLGAGSAWNRNAVRTAGQIGESLGAGNDVAKDFRTIFADAMFKWNGWSVYAEYMRRTVSDDPFAPNGEFVLEGEGLNLQSGWFFAEHWEAVARAARVRPGDRVLAAINDQTQYTLGLNRYLRGHRVKIQSDLSWNEDGSDQNWIARFQIELGI